MPFFVTEGQAPLMPRKHILLQVLILERPVICGAVPHGTKKVLPRDIIRPNAGIGL
jgi:hypothetical protein